MSGLLQNETAPTFFSPVINKCLDLARFVLCASFQIGVCDYSSSEIASKSSQTFSILAAPADRHPGYGMDKKLQLEMNEFRNNWSLKAGKAFQNNEECSGPFLNCELKFQSVGEKKNRKTPPPWNRHSTAIDCIDSSTGMLVKRLRFKFAERDSSWTARFLNVLN